MCDLLRDAHRAILISLLLVSAAVAGGPPESASADATASEARLLSNTRQLTFEGRRAGEGYFSADGTKLVFQSEREPDNPFFQIYLMDLETGDTQRISPGHGKTTCAWIHPSGDKVLYASTHEDPQAREKQREELEARATGTQRRYSWDYDPHYDLFDHDLATGEVRNLTNAFGYNAEGSWSPDGRLICFASNRHAYSEELSEADRERLERDQAYFMDLYIMDADGGNLRRLTNEPGYDGGPFFSTDGRRICWRRFSPDGATAEIYTMKVDGSDVRQLTRMEAMSWAPFFHPSGEYLIFTTNLHGFDNFELYLVDADGAREPVRVTYTPGFDGLPAFSPDGRRLAWTSSRHGGGQGQLYLADWNDAEARRALGASPLLAGRASEAESGATKAEVQAAEPEGETRPEIRAADARIHVEQLCREEMEGRLTGTEGERLATAYVAEQFARFGLAPAGEDGTFFQSFEFTAGAALGRANGLTMLEQYYVEGVEDAQIAERTQFQLDEDWRPLAFSQTGTFDDAEVVFAGYGIVAPAEGDQEGYDSFVHLDVSDKWVMVLRFMPEDIPPERRQHLGRFSTLRYKAMVLRDRGAHGMIVVSGPKANVREPLVRLAFDAAMSGTSIPAVSISDAAADRLLARSGRAIRELQETLDGGAPQMGFGLKDVKLGASIDIQKIRRTGRNVLARLPAGADAQDAPIVAIGAHVDHLGRGEGTNSLARDVERGEIHYGADDNASGVAALLEIAEYLADAQRRGRLELKRDVLFAAWSGEELGLLGSQRFVEQVGRQLGNPTDIRGAVAAYLNMDMVGRLSEKLILNGVGSSPFWAGEIERRNAPIGLPIQAQDDSFLPTDSTAFYMRGVPVLSAFTGSHAEYHTPRDTPDTLNYEGIEKIARFMALMVRSLATADETPEYVAMTQPQPMGQRAGMRAYLGTIPDYADTGGQGLRLSGVTKGAPADTAGLRAGDLIVELAGKTIENVYDYTYAITAMKVGQPVRVVVTRDGQRLEMEITPGSRE